MREKILSLAKGNFIYETPKLCLSIEKLVFEVTAGTHGTASFLLENSFGTRVKGFGTVEEMCIDFLPFFDGTKNELTVDVDAGELNPGEKLKGNLDLITDCGEEKLPYEITIVSPVLRDEEGEIRDYPTLKKRIEKNPEHGVDLFLAPEFRDAFLYRDESGRILYDCLLKKNTKLQSLEEFLVAMKKKKAIRFETEHPSGRELIYELDGTDKADAITIRVNTWGHAGIHVRTTADFIEVQTHVLCTDEFVDGREKSNTYYSAQPNWRKRAKDSKSQKKSDCHGNSYVFIISGEAGYERGIRKVPQKEPRNSRKNQWHI